MPDPTRTGSSSLLEQLPTDRLAEQGQLLLGLLAERAVGKAIDSVEGLVERLIDHAHGGPGLVAATSAGEAPADAKSPLRARVQAGVTGASESVKQAFGGVPVPHKSERTTKTMNIAEQIDVGVPVRLAYDQWTRFQDFSQFMKKVRAVERTSDETSSWKVQIFWLNRDWEATIIEQIPDERIVWRSEGAKGHVSGAVSFHAVTPNLTRILFALEYCPDGLVERAGSLWRAHTRRVRLEIRQFRHHVMTRAVIDPNSMQGWRGEIRDSKVVRTHEEAIAAEARECGEDQERAEAPDTPTEDDLDAAGEDDYDDADDHDADYDGADDYDGANDDDGVNDYDGADDDADYDADDIDDDDADELYEGEPEREPARPGRR